MKATFRLHWSLKFVLNKYALSQALWSCPLKSERSESMTTKPTLNKNIRSPAPLHKKKSSYGPHGVVRSSGYGRPTSLSKQSFPANEKKAPKETSKKTSVKARIPADRARSKGNFLVRSQSFKSQRAFLFMLSKEKKEKKQNGVKEI